MNLLNRTYVAKCIKAQLNGLTVGKTYDILGLFVENGVLRVVTVGDDLIFSAWDATAFAPVEYIPKGTVEHKTRNSTGETITFYPAPEETLLPPIASGPSTTAVDDQFAPEPVKEDKGVKGGRKTN